MSGKHANFIDILKEPQTHLTFFCLVALWNAYYGIRIVDASNSILFLWRISFRNRIVFLFGRLLFNLIKLFSLERIVFTSQCIWKFHKAKAKMFCWNFRNLSKSFLFDSVVTVNMEIVEKRNGDAHPSDVKERVVKNYN